MALPFKRSECEEKLRLRHKINNDSAENADADVKLFNRLLDEESTAIFEIQASHKKTDYAYADVAHVLLNHCDLLIAVWDKDESAFISGTTATVKMANKLHIPIIHIDAQNPTEVCLIRDGLQTTSWKEVIHSYLDNILLPDVASKKTLLKKLNNKSDTQCKKHVSQKRGGGFLLSSPPNPGPFNILNANIEKGFRKFVSFFWGGEGNFPPAYDKKEIVPAGDASDNPADNPWDEIAKEKDDWTQRYAVRYRSCLVLRFITPVLAMISMVCCLYGEQIILQIGELFEADVTGACELFKGGKIFFVACNVLALLAAILLEVTDKMILKWHKKFFLCRVTAELLRHSKYLWSAGYCNVRSHHRTAAQEDGKWTFWYYRALMREQGVPSKVIDTDKVRAWFSYILDELVIDQMNYHHKRTKKEGRISAGMFNAGMILFIISVIASLCIHISGFGLEPVEQTCAQCHKALMCVCGAAPEVLDKSVFKSICEFIVLVIQPLAVLCTGFCRYAGYPYNMKISQKTESGLDAIKQDIEALLLPAVSDEKRCNAPNAASPKSVVYTRMTDDPICYTHMLQVAERVHECCMEELMDWESMIVTKDISCN